MDEAVVDKMMGALTRQREAALNAAARFEAEYTVAIEKVAALTKVNEDLATENAALKAQATPGDPPPHPDANA